MRFLITEYFLKTIPIEKNFVLLKKLRFFNDLLQKNLSFSIELPKGFWIKKINGSDSLYEFRINNGDRVFFKFERKRKREQDYSRFIFLIFSSHDRAVKKAKRKELSETNLKDFIIFDENDNIEDIDEKYFDYNNMITYEIIDDLEFLKNFEDKRYNYYYLNDEQYSCLIDFPPYFVTGSAGSGKSTLTIRKLLNLEENKEFYNIEKILYLTSNKYLRDKSQEQYEDFRKKGQRIANFLTLKELFCGELNILSKKIVDFIQFKNFLKISYPQLKKFHLTPEEIYSEINGVLKGIMINETVDNWNRDLKNILLKKDEYFSLNSNYTTLNNQDRELIYSIAERYCKWLKENNLFDLNDLARLILKNSGTHYDFLIIDELQDMTELQIYAIMSLVKNKDNIFLAGDIHQMINSTYFSFDRIKNLFFSKYNKRITTKTLYKNYRSAGKIVEIANYFAEFRAKTIGSMGVEDYKEISILKEGKVLLTSMNKKLLQEAQNDVNSAIIVPDEIVKSELSEVLENRHRIFTIQEIKGLEYLNIICYNLSSNYKEQWEKIFSKKVKYDQKYRKYFNIFYVGITRARENLIIMENNIENNLLLEKIQKFLIPTNDIEINKKSKDKSKEKKEWLEEGIKLYKLEQLEEADYAFKKAGEPTWILEYELTEKIKNKELEEATKLLKHPMIQPKSNLYKKMIIDCCIENEILIEGIEYNHDFKISYRENELKDKILLKIEKEQFTKNELKKIISFFEKKRDIKSLADILLSLKEYEKALEFYYNLKDKNGIYHSRKGILLKKFENISDIDKKIKELDKIIHTQNINSFDKNDKLTPAQRAIILEKNELLFEMVLVLGGRFDSYVKGKELLPFYTLKYMNFSKKKEKIFIEIFIKYGFNFNEKQYLFTYLTELKIAKKLIKYGVLNIKNFENFLDSFSVSKLDFLMCRKILLLKKIIMNTKREEKE